MSTRTPSIVPSKGQSPQEPRNPREEGNSRSCSLPAVQGHTGWRQTCPRAEVGWEGDIAGPGAEGWEINSGKEREMVLNRRGSAWHRASQELHRLGTTNLPNTISATRLSPWATLSPPAPTRKRHRRRPHLPHPSPGPAFAPILALHQARFAMVLEPTVPAGVASCPVPIASWGCLGLGWWFHGLGFCFFFNNGKIHMEK